jgi:hypothetical protein
LAGGSSLVCALKILKGFQEFQGCDCHCGGIRYSKEAVCFFSFAEVVLFYYSMAVRRKSQLCENSRLIGQDKAPVMSLRHGSRYKQMPDA